MSRFHEGDGDNPFEYLWHYMIHRSAQSKRGQRVLEDMRRALLAMPERRLAHSSLLTKDGATCAVGAFARAKGIDLTKYRDVEVDGTYTAPYVRHADADDTIEVGIEAGMQKTLASHFGFMNDVELPERRFYIPKHSVYVEVIDDSPNAQRQAMYGWRASSWDGNYDTHPLRRTERVEEYRWDHPGYENGVTDEERWEAVYRWVCRNLRVDNPPALIAA